MSSRLIQSSVHRSPATILCASVALLCFCGSGCGPQANEEQLRNEVLKAEPSFADALNKRDELDNRIMQLERELALKQTQVDRQITLLRKELQETRVQVTQKTQKITAVLKPYLERVDHALAMASEELSSKRSQRASISRSISRLRKALKQEKPPWTEPERARMDQELAELLRETERLDHEIAALNEHIRLLKLKRLLLRL